MRLNARPSDAADDDDGRERDQEVAKAVIGRARDSRRIANLGTHRWQGRFQRFAVAPNDEEDGNRGQQQRRRTPLRAWVTRARSRMRHIESVDNCVR